MNIIRKYLITLFILLNMGIVYANSCLVIADKSITEIVCPKDSVIRAKVLSTLSNDRKSAIITSVKDGETNFIIKVKNRSYGYKAIVKSGNIEIKGSKQLKFLEIDLPEEALPKGDCEQ